jgi:maltose O-acetyltransferase
MKLLQDTGSERVSSSDANARNAAPRPEVAPQVKRPFVIRAFGQIRDDILGSRLHWLAAQAVTGAMPRMTFGWLRPVVYRTVGLRVGERTRIYGKLTLEGVGAVIDNVSIGENCLVTTPIYLNASAEIRIGDRVTIGHHVVIITDDHRMDDPERRGGERSSRPVFIEDGVWIAARATILPGVTLGRGCVVAAGSLVNRDVPAHTLVAGVPARRIKDLPR